MSAGLEPETGEEACSSSGVDGADDAGVPLPYHLLRAHSVRITHAVHEPLQWATYPLMTKLPAGRFLAWARWP